MILINMKNYVYRNETPNMIFLWSFILYDLISRATPDLSLLIKFSVDLIVRVFQSTDFISKAIFEFSFSCYKASSHTVKNYNENFQ